MITQLSDFFISGNMIHMSILTILLASVFLSAWKAPAWVWKIGLLAMVCGILFGVLGYYQINDAIQKTLLESGDIAPSVLMGGYKCMSKIPRSRTHWTVLFAKVTTGTRAERRRRGPYPQACWMACPVSWAATAAAATVRWE